MLSLSQNVPGYSGACPNVDLRSGWENGLRYTRGGTRADRSRASRHLVGVPLAPGCFK